MFTDLLFIENSIPVPHQLKSAISTLNDIVSESLEYFNTDLNERENILLNLKSFEKSILKLTEFQLQQLPRPQELGKSENIIINFLSEFRALIVPLEAGDENQKLSSLSERELKIILRKLIKAHNYFLFSDPDLLEFRGMIVSFFESAQNGQKQKLDPKLRSAAVSVISKLKEKWQSICVAAYRCMRIIAETPAPNSERYITRTSESSRACELALMFVPTDFIANNETVIQFEDGAITEIFRSINNARIIKSKTVFKYYRTAKYTLKCQPYDWEFHSSYKQGKLILSPAEQQTRQKFKEFESLFEKPPSDINDESNIDSDDITLDTHQYEINEGAAPSEVLDLLENPPAYLASEGSASRTGYHTDYLNLPEWSGDTITPEICGLLDTWINHENAVLEPTAQLKFSIYLEFLFVYGFAARALCNAMIDPKGIIKTQCFDNNVKNLPVIWIDDDRVYVRPVRAGSNESIFGKPLKDESHLYRPSSNYFSLPLTRNLKQKLNALSEENANHALAMENSTHSPEPYYVFSKPGIKRNNQEHLSVKDFNIMLRDFNSEFRRLVTVQRLERGRRSILIRILSAQSHLTDFVSGEMPFGSVSPSFYTSYTSTKIENYVTENAFLFLKLITDAAQPRALSNLADSTPNKINTQISERLQFISQTMSENSFVGSPFFPLQKVLSEYLMKLYDLLEDRSTDWTIRHNRLTAYVVLILMLLTGMRPMELENLFIGKLNLDASAGLLPVAAKVNLAHQEWRASPFVKSD